MTEKSIDLEPVKEGLSTDTDQKIYEILNTLLQLDSSTTPAEAAKQINEHFPVRSAEQAAADRSDAEETFLWNFWALLIKIVQLVTRDHSGQVKLSLTMKELSRLPPKVVRIWGFETSVWADSALLRPCMRENWGRDGIAHWDTYAIWELREALEKPSMPRSIMNCEVAVAAEWILHAGQELFRRLSEEGLSEVEARETQGGILYQGKAGLCRERWEFWKMRLNELSSRVDKDVGERVLRAVQEMGRIERLEV